LGNPKKRLSTILFMRDSDYVRFLRTKSTAAAVQLNHKCLLAVTWTVISRRVADARAAARDPQH